MGRADAQRRRHDPPLATEPLTLVLDASAVLNACLGQDGFRPYARETLVAPPLLWSEVPSALHEGQWRGELPREAATGALKRLAEARIIRKTHPRLILEAWRIADELGWAKTYDAEFVALAALLDCQLVTLDLRLRRGAAALGFVVTPTEL